jgi:hypothetical protein
MDSCLLKVSFNMVGLLKKFLSNNKLSGRMGAGNDMLGEPIRMSVIRIKIIVFWLIFVLFWLLLYFCWRYRFLWAALFPAAMVSLELIQPRRRSPTPQLPRCRPAMPRRIKTLLWLLVMEWVLIVIVHGFLYPHSAGLYLVSKLVLVATAAPLLYYKVQLDYRAWLDYGALRAAQKPSAEPSAPPKAAVPTEHPLVHLTTRGEERRPGR